MKEGPDIARIAALIGDPARAKRYLGFEPQYRLADAVKDLAEWMRRHPTL